MENQQPAAALRAADSLDLIGRVLKDIPTSARQIAIRELRRLHARNQELEQCLESFEQKLVASLEQLQLACAQGAEIQLRRLLKRMAELEDMLEAVGAGGVSAPRVTQGKDHIAQDRKMVAAQEPFGYFKAEPFGWRDCAETDEGAIALYEAPQPQADARDAERYRFLRSRDLETINNGGVFAGVTPDNIVLNGTALDAEIDAAIAAAKEI